VAKTGALRRQRVHPSSQKNAHYAGVVVNCCSVQRFIPKPVVRIWIRSSVDQDLDCCAMSFLRCVEQRRLLLDINTVKLHADTADKKLEILGQSIPGCNMTRCDAFGCTRTPFDVKPSIESRAWCEEIIQK